MIRYSQIFQVAKCSNTLKLYALLNKNRYYFFLSSSDMQKFHHLLGCHAFVINSSLISFFKVFAFFKFNMPSRNSDKNNSITGP